MNRVWENCEKQTCHICTFDFACPLNIAYVSVTLIGSVIIDNQSILTLIEAWLTVARDSPYHTEQFTINARYQSAVNLSR